MRPVLIAVLDRLVGDEPDVAATAPATGRCLPAADIGRILVLDADAAPIEQGPSGRCEMEHELLTIVEESAAVDGLVVTHREVPLQSGGSASRVALDDDGLHPVDDVLEMKVRANRLGDVQGAPGPGGFGADVQKQRPVGCQRPRRAAHPGLRPGQIVLARQAVLVGAIGNPEIVGRRGHHGGDRALGDPREHVQAVAVVKPQYPTAARGVQSWPAENPTPQAF